MQQMLELDKMFKSMGEYPAMQISEDSQSINFFE